MLTLIKNWISTATEEEILELQKITEKHIPQDIIKKKVIEIINDGYYIKAIVWVQEKQNITFDEARNIVDEIKNNN